jgi:hypothetical protein
MYSEFLEKVSEPLTRLSIEKIQTLQDRWFQRWFFPNMKDVADDL